VRDGRVDLQRLEGDPLAVQLKTRVTHPQSADETLRQGCQLSAPGSINGATKTCNMLSLLLAVPTCCAGPVCVHCCIAPPDVHFELQELRSGGAVEGARCTNKGRIFCEVNGCLTTGVGDTIDFSERVPLQVRKDTLAIVFYKRVVPAVAPVFNTA